MIIELLDGTEIDISSYNLGVENYKIPSIEIEHSVANVEGVGNPIVIDTKFVGRKISVTFCYNTSDYSEYVQLRKRLNELFVRNTPFYIKFKDDLSVRWYVRLSTQFATDEELETIGAVNVEFRCEKIYSQSSELIVKTFKAATFTIDNEGTVAINPRESQLDIAISGTFAKQVKITNQTTGDVFIYNGALQASEILKLSGVQMTKGNQNILKNTNKKLITLTTGENKFLVEGGTVGTIAFNYRHLYL